MQNAQAAKIDVQGSLSVSGNNGHGINIHGNANVSEISINGNLSANGSNGQGINIMNNANVGTITLGSNGSINSQHRRAILVNKNATINHIDIQGTITNGRGVWNDGIIGMSNGSGEGTGTTPGIKVTGSITSTSESAAALGNGGTINGNIVVENSATLTGGKKFNTNLYTALANEGVINGNIEIKQGATLMGGITNMTFSHKDWGGKLNGNIKVEGNVGGNIENHSGTITGSIEITENANVNGNIRLGRIGQRVYGKVEGDIIVKGTLNGNIDSSGTIGGKIQYEGKTAVNIYNRPGGVIQQGITNKGTATIHNQGKIQNGIINDGGTLTV
ncbi:hypothetical protein CVU4313_08210, partial [Campylobacter vulpis]|uniref:hypothetical protein n=1 Tax=Campylobacter vulpis TaxID=1655500 RepID=UPI001BD0AD54